MDRDKVVRMMLTFLACVAAVGIVFLFIFGERYLLRRHPQRGPLVLVGQPAWASEEMVESVYQAAGAREFPLHTESLERVAERLEQSCWLENVRVQLTTDSMTAHADWLQPVALVKYGTTRFYVDQHCVALEAVTLTNLPLVTLKNIKVPRRPPLGRVVDRDDLKAAVALVSVLKVMDHEIVPSKPLLREIESIDMENYRGRKKKNAPHIIIYTLDKTPIEWGAELDSWAQFMEAPDQVKLSRLYTYYKDRQYTLQGAVKHINLHMPEEIPRPSQKYQTPSR
jgi:hypothetical protein